MREVAATEGLAGARAAVIEHYGRRLDREQWISERQFLHDRIADLKAGRTVQVGYNDLPEELRSGLPFHSLFELRGDRLVPVSTWKPRGPRPADWTV